MVGVVVVVVMVVVVVVQKTKNTQRSINQHYSYLSAPLLPKNFQYGIETLHVRMLLHGKEIMYVRSSRNLGSLNSTLTCVN